MSRPRTPTNNQTPKPFTILSADGQPICPRDRVCPTCGESVEALETHRHLVRVTLGPAARIELAWTLTDPRVAEVELIADPDYFPEALLVWSKEPEASASTGPLAALENQLAFPFTLRETPLSLIARFPRFLQELGFVAGIDPLSRWLTVAAANGLRLASEPQGAQNEWCETLTRAFPGSHRLHLEIAKVLPRHVGPGKAGPAQLRRAIEECWPMTAEAQPIDQVHAWFGPVVAAFIHTQRDPDLASQLLVDSVSTISMSQNFIGQRLEWLACYPDSIHLPILAQAVSMTMSCRSPDHAMLVAAVDAYCRRYPRLRDAPVMSDWTALCFRWGRSIADWDAPRREELLHFCGGPTLASHELTLHARLGLSPTGWTPDACAAAVGQWFDEVWKPALGFLNDHHEALFRSALGIQFGFRVGFAAGLLGPAPGSGRRPIRFDLEAARRMVAAAEVAKDSHLWPLELLRTQVSRLGEAPSE